MSKHSPAKRLLEFVPIPAIALTRDAVTAFGRPRWALVLVWFCRLCALMWLVAGLLHWAFMLGIIVVPGVSFDTSPLASQIAEGFFAVVDLVAAVGLWLLAPWGGPVWLLAAAAQIALPFVLHDYGSGTLLTIATNTLLAAIYIALVFVKRRSDIE